MHILYLHIRHYLVICMVQFHASEIHVELFRHTFVLLISHTINSIGHQFKSFLHNVFNFGLVKKN